VHVNLPAMMANQGRNAEAIPLLRDAIEGYRNTHGPRTTTGVTADRDTRGERQHLRSWSKPGRRGRHLADAWPER
jgi:hypothetical protein